MTRLDPTHFHELPFCQKERGPSSALLGNFKAGAFEIPSGADDRKLLGNVIDLFRLSKRNTRID